MSTTFYVMVILMSGNLSSERPFAFALPDSETSHHPMAGTIVDQILALEEMGETELAANLTASAQQEIADIFAEEEAVARRVKNEQ